MAHSLVSDFDPNGYTLVLFLSSMVTGDNQVLGTVIMKIVCAWCGKDMGEKPPFEDKSVTHGMCPECYKKVKGK